MRKLLSALAAAVLAVSFALPVNAAPMFVPRPEQVNTGAAEAAVEQVNHWRHRQWRSERHWNRRYASRSCRYYGRCYPRHYRHYSYRDYHRYHRRQGVTVYFNF